MEGRAETDSSEYGADTAGPRVLLVEDNPGDARLIREFLSEDRSLAPDITHVEHLTDALGELSRAHFDVVLLDLSLPDSSGLETFLRVRKAHPDTAIVVLSGLSDEQVGVEAVRAGAQDYLVKGQVSTSVIVRSLRYSIERMRSELELRRSLLQKEVLLKEVHHRVKNNLQVIASMLSLQSRYVGDEHVRRMFEESRNRVMSMALVHEELYRARNWAAVDFGEYIKNLSRFLLASYGAQQRGIKLSVQAASAHLKINTAIPCGLILNELISNSLKHAFTAGKGGNISVELSRSDSDEFLLHVRDDGIGLPAGYLANPPRSSLGLELVLTLGRQLGAEIVHEEGPGTNITIRFRE